MTAQKLISDYKLWLDEQNLSGMQVRERLKHAKKILAEKIRKSTYTEFGPEDIRAYLPRILSERTTLPFFIKWLVSCGKVNLDTFQNRKPVEVERVAQEYLAGLRAQGFQKKTLATISARLKHFVDYLAKLGITGLEQISKKVVADFVRQVHMRENPKRPGQGYELSYKVKLLSEVKSFFSFLQKQGHVLFDPSLVINLPKQPKRSVQGVLGVDEINALGQVMGVQDIFGFRDLCLLELLYATGVRAGEAVRALLEDLDLSGRTLLVRNGKGRKDRVVPVSRYAVELLKRYVDHTRRRIIRTTKSRERLTKGLLFLNIYGHKMSPESVSRGLTRYARQARLKKKVTAHTLRHTCATHLLKNGADIRFIQKILGHERLATTQVYTKVALTELHDVICKYHPLEGGGCATPGG
jgi:integrase/recombinase XerD